MTMTKTPAAEIAPIGRGEAHELSATENSLVLDLLASLSDDDWNKPTECPGWDVRALAGHVLGGMEGFSSFGRLVHLMRATRKEAEEGSFVDAMTSIQVRERIDLTRPQLLARLDAAGPKSARFRHRFPSPMRAVSTKQQLLDGTTERWKMAYLVDVILTRDTWMHRIDLARATGNDPVLTRDHDGRIVADAVGEWARRHGQPFTLELTGPLAEVFEQGAGSAPIALDAVEFCRVLSGRGSGEGLLAEQVPF